MTFSSAIGSKGRNANLVYPTDAVHKKILQGQSFTIPENAQLISVSTGAVSSRPSAGAVIYSISSNDPNTNEMASFQPKEIAPGRTLAVAVAANKLTVTLDGNEIYSIQGSALTVGAVSLYYM